MWFIYLIILSCPHLMLPNICCNNGIPTCLLPKITNNVGYMQIVIVGPGEDVTLMAFCTPNFNLIEPIIMFKFIYLGDKIS